MGIPKNARSRSLENADLGDINPNTVALLEVLAMGEREIETGRFESAERVFGRLRSRKNS